MVRQLIQINRARLRARQRYRREDSTDQRVASVLKNRNGDAPIGKDSYYWADIEWFPCLRIER